MDQTRYDAETARAALRPRPEDFHKRKAVVLALAGSKAYLGAALLCARAAYRAGAGLVRLVLPEALTPYAQAALPEAVIYGLPVPEAVDVACQDAVLELAKEAHAALVGPGLGRAEGTAELVRRLWRDLELPALFDADALRALRPGAEARGPRVLTPHEGELRAMLGPRSLDKGRVAAVSSLAFTYKATALLKGPDTLIARPDGSLSRNTGASRVLATAGSGDALAGLVAALLAQGYEPYEAARLGAWIHGRAASSWSEDHADADRGMLASDLAERFPEILGGLLQPGRPGFPPVPPAP